MLTNLVGSVLPTEEEARQIDAALETARQGLHRFGVVVPPEDRGSFIKPRNGAAKLMPLVFQLAVEKSIRIDGVPLEGMNADLNVGGIAERIERQLEELRQIAADTRLVAYSEAFRAFLGYYAVLSSMAKRDAALANRLQPVVDFMSTGPRAKRVKT